jgi:signal transduction histidine kinase
MAEITKAALETAIRNDFLTSIIQFIADQYETDALMVSSSELAVPTVDALGNEKFALIKVSIPRGSRNGDGSYTEYDGYKAHELYVAEMEARDAKKAARDARKEAEEKERERKRAARAAKQQQKEKDA